MAIKRTRRQTTPRNGRGPLKSIFNQELISRIYKEHLLTNKKKRNNPMGEGEALHCKRMSKCAVNIQRCAQPHQPLKQCRLKPQRNIISPPREWTRNKVKWKWQKIRSVSKATLLKHSHASGGSVNWYNHFGSLSGYVCRSSTYAHPLTHQVYS